MKAKSRFWVVGSTVDVEGSAMALLPVSSVSVVS